MGDDVPVLRRRAHQDYRNLLTAAVQQCSGRRAEAEVSTGGR
jgi:hypothetical protein